jgi:hypothetical protein
MSTFFTYAKSDQIKLTYLTIFLEFILKFNNQQQQQQSL